MRVLSQFLHSVTVEKICTVLVRKSALTQLPKKLIKVRKPAVTSFKPKSGCQGPKIKNIDRYGPKTVSISWHYPHNNIVR
jgi:hypothetical protein